jgi:uncharacterized membrane protein
MPKPHKALKRKDSSSGGVVTSTQAKSVVSSQIQTIYSSGPLPSPDVLERYEFIVPGAGERIVASFEQQSAHRQALERRSIEIQADNLRWQAELAAKTQHSQFRTTRLGQIFAFFLAIGFLAGSLYSIAAGNDVSGTVLAGATLSSLVGIFIYGSRSKSNRVSDQNKTEAAPPAPRS